MRLHSLLALCLLAGPALADPSAKARQPYEGLWADDQKACRDPDGVNRMEINGRRFFWYETRCTASEVKPASGGPSPAQSWTMRMACEGEGERFSARPRLTLASPNRLVIENSPVGPNTKRQAYILCRRF